MGLLPSLLLILTCLSGSFGQYDLQNMAFVFPSDTAAVHLFPSRQQPLTKLTVCLRHYGFPSPSSCLFSYATQTTINDFLILKKNLDEYSIYIGGSNLNFKAAPKAELSWEHICVSWDSSNGLLQFWLNGKPFPRRSLKMGYTLSQVASIVLGQQVESYGGLNKMNQSFVGEISDVYLFPRVLTPLEVRMARSNVEIPDPLISWRSLRYTDKGGAYLEDILPPQDECI